MAAVPVAGGGAAGVEAPPAFGGNYTDVMASWVVPAAPAAWDHRAKYTTALDMGDDIINAYVGLFTVPGIDEGRTRLLHPGERQARLGYLHFGNWL